MAAISAKDVYLQLKSVLGHLSHLLRVEDANALFSDLAANLGLFGTVESVLFYQGLVAAELPDPSVAALAESVREAAVSVVWLLVVGQAPALQSKGEPAAKCVFNERGSTAYNVVRKHLLDKLDYSFLALLFRPQLAVRRRSEADLDPPAAHAVAQIVRFAAHARHAEDFPKVQEQLAKLVADEETATVVNSSGAYFVNNLAKFGRVAASIEAHFEFVNFLLVYNDDAPRLLAESPFMTGFQWRVYFFALELEQQVARLPETDSLLARLAAIRKLVICVVDNYFAGLELGGVFEPPFAATWSKGSKVKTLERHARALAPLLDGLLKRQNAEKSMKSLVNVHTKLIVRNAPKMVAFVNFVNAALPGLKAELPAFDRLPRYWKAKAAVKAEKPVPKAGPQRPADDLNQLDELARKPEKAARKDDERHLQVLNSVITKSRTKDSKPAFKVAKDIYEGLYDDEYDDTFDAPLYAPKEAADSENEDAVSGASQPEDGAPARPPGPRPPVPRPPPKHSRRDRQKRNKRDYNNKTRQQYFSSQSNK